MNTEKNDKNPDVKCKSCNRGFDITSEEGGYNHGDTAIVECPKCGTRQEFFVDVTVKYEAIN